MAFDIKQLEALTDASTNGRHPPIVDAVSTCCAVRLCSRFRRRSECVAPRLAYWLSDDVVSASNLPITKQPSAFLEFYVMPFTHLVYAVTWYAL